MNWKFWEKSKDRDLEKKYFMDTIKHFIPYTPSKGKAEHPFLFAILPLKDGVLASLPLEDFKIYDCEENKVVCTNNTKTSQIIIDYDAGFITAIFGWIFYDFENEKRVENERTNYHG